MKAARIQCFVVALRVTGAAAVLQLMGCSQGNPSSTAPSEAVNVAAIQSKAQSGDAKAQAQLGQLYAKGQGVTNSYVEAAKWYQRAADQTNAQAILSLGEL